MPKMKTNKSVLKRFRATRRGKVMHMKCGKSHLLSTKSAKRRRHLRKKTALLGAKAKAIKRLIGEG